MEWKKTPFVQIHGNLHSGKKYEIQVGLWTLIQINWNMNDYAKNGNVFHIFLVLIYSVLVFV